MSGELVLWVGWATLTIGGMDTSYKLAPAVGDLKVTLFSNHQFCIKQFIPISDKLY
jgi:hypothetical protein